MSLAPKLTKIGRDARGSVVVFFALLLPVMLLVIGGAIDVGIATSQRQQLQALVDAAALAAARELSLADARSDNVQSVLKANVHAAATERGTHSLSPSVETVVRNNPPEVAVKARQLASSYFGNAFGLGRVEIEVEAVARIVGQPSVCVLALEDSDADAISMKNNSNMVGQKCSVFSNSRSKSGISIKDGAAMTAESICSAGGVDPGGAMTPPPYLDCPQFQDPLKSREEPLVGACQFDKIEVKGSNATLKPGVYCGGLTISGSSEVKLEPGAYIIKNGTFRLSGKSSITGDEVSFYLGPDVGLDFEQQTTVAMTASRSGALAGLLFFGSRQQSASLTHTILSQNAQRLVGTIYLPRSVLVVDGDAKVGAESAYTAIVVRQLALKNGPHLVLNSDYHLTDVPVPDGIRGAGIPPTLVK